MRDSSYGMGREVGKQGQASGDRDWLSWQTGSASTRDLHHRGGEGTEKIFNRQGRRGIAKYAKKAFLITKNVKGHE
jgi:hypothetical protein